MDPTAKITNSNLVSKLDSGDLGQLKEAQEGVNDYLRIRAREDGFARGIMEARPVTPDQFTKQVDTDMPCIVKDMEPNSTGAFSIPFGQGAGDAYMGAPRYRIMFRRNSTERYRTDIAKLYTYDADLKDLFSDLLLKDLMDEEDRKFIGRVDTMLGDLDDSDTSTNSRLNTVGAMGFVTVGAVSRESLFHARGGTVSTNRHLPPSKNLCNVLFLNEVAALGRDSLGGDIAENVFTNGWTETNIAGLPTLATIKTDLVPNLTMYTFSDPKYLGDFLIAEDVTVSFKKEDYWIMLRAYELIGASIKNEAGASKAQFNGSRTEWVPSAGSSS
jgi:hypothetical protein